MKIINENNSEILADEIIVADNFFTRLKGLMFRKSLEEKLAMLIYPCNSVHTFFMKFPLDIVFLSKEYEVLHIIENMMPRKISPYIRKTKSVLELPAGVIKNTKTKKGDFLKIY